MRLGRGIFAWIAAAVIMASCANPTPALDLVPSTPSAIPPTPTPDLKLPSAAAVASAFVSAINRQDFVAAFTLLDAPSRAELKDADALRNRYDAVRAIALATNMEAQLRGGLLYQGERAGAVLVTRWESSLVGPFEVTSTLELVFDPPAADWRVSWTRDTIIPGLANGILRMEREDTTRGAIYAADGTPLAVQLEFTTIGVQRGAIANADEEQRMLDLLSRITQLAPEEIKAKYADQPESWFSPIADVDEALIDEYYDQIERFPAISTRPRFQRRYPNPDIAPHVVGFVGFIPPESLAAYRARGFQGDERIGMTGVEAGADALIGGAPGGVLKLFSGGHLTILADRPAAQGQDVTLTISPSLQLAVQRLLGNRRGAAVVLRADDSAVLAMASSPTFSQTNVTGRAIQEGALLNRATQGQYPPGSTFKMVTMAAGIAEGVTTPDEAFRDPGFWDGYGADFRKTCWLRSGHGRISLQAGLTASCNVVFYEVGKRLQEKSAYVLGEYARKFGFGVRTGIELPEAAGLVPDPDWKRQALGEVWTGGDTVNLAVGQGFMLATPLQVAQMTAAIANGGFLRQPYLIASPRAASTDPPPTLPVTPATLRSIQQGMIGVTRDARLGTTTYRFAGFDYCFDTETRVVPCSRIPARSRAGARRLIVAGKSGTAQAGGDAKPFAWFTAYAPADAPEIVVTVLLENIGEGSSYAAPLVRQIIEAYYGLPISPTPRDRRVNE
ncbi:MAG: penicillin-binding transpeptidase domain-containing protein [Candidatus Brachytrichaceae bacterium NZ_4S206]|jgi:penicillin-binding protein 2